MRSHLPVIAVSIWLAAMPLQAQVPRARAWTECDTVRFALTESVKAQPQTLEMRLEDALVIRRECAAEIVTAAIEAVDAKPQLVEKIVAIALKVAPERRRTILHAATHYSPRQEIAAVDIEVRRAVLPGEPIEEVRRAEIPPAGPTSVGPGLVLVKPVAPMPEVRRAIRVPAAALAEEARRAQVSQPDFARPGRRTTPRR